MFSGMNILVLLIGCIQIINANSVSLFRKEELRDAIAPKGTVQWTECGMATNTTVKDIRIDRCQSGDVVCHVDPGYFVSVEADLIPGHATKSLRLGVDAVLGNGFRVSIMTAGVPNSSVQPGNIYVIKFSMVPNDVLSGQTFHMEVDILDDQDNAIFCVSTLVHVNPFIMLNV